MPAAVPTVPAALLALLLGLVPLAAGQAPAPLPDAPALPLPGEAEGAVCALAGGVPAHVPAVDDLAGCSEGPDARAGAPAAQGSAAPVAEAQVEEATDAAEDAVALAGGFAEATLADPAGTPGRAPGFLDAFLAWLEEHVVGAVPRALTGAGDAAQGALTEVGAAAAGLGVGAEQSVRAAAGALEGAMERAAAMLTDAAQAVGSLLRGGSAGGPRNLPVEAPKGLDRAPGKIQELLPDLGLLR
jgi:hypothetical protein